MARLPRAGSYFGDEREILIGPGSLDRLPDRLRELGVRRAYLVASSSATRSEAGTRITTALAPLIAGSFETVARHSPIEQIREMLAAAQSCKADGVIAIGGGSSIDAAKAVTLLLRGTPVVPASSRPELHPLPPGSARPEAPLILVPTTLSGAEMTPWGVFLDGEEKIGFPPDPSTSSAAGLVVLDPVLFAGVSRQLLVTTGMNALAHCIEGAYSRDGNAISAAMAVEGGRLLVESMLALTDETPHEESVLMPLLTGAALGGLVLRTAQVCVHHGLCHSLGSICGLPHGVSNAVLLPYSARFNEEDSATVQQRFAQALGPALEVVGADGSGGLPRVLAALQRAAGAPASLREAGVRHEDLSAVAEQAMASPTLGRNPRAVHGPGELIGILEAAFAGELRAGTGKDG